MTTALLDVLSRHRLDLSEQRFAQLVEQALSEIGGAAAVDPTATLSSDDVAALRAVGADLARRRPREADPRATGAAAYTALLADSLSVSEAARRIGIDPSRVRHRLAQHRLLGVRQVRGWLLPVYQFGADGQPLPGLERVAEALASRPHPVVVARFFATAQPELVVARRKLTPRAWLESGGDPAPVAALAGSLDLLA